jgi:hypothetical protein
VSPTVSVVIPTYNRPALLAEAIASVLAQTVDDLEVVVVDDGGPEPAVVPDDPRVVLLRHEVNQGKAAAVNAGIERSTGRIVAFLDDDDLWLPRRLEMVVDRHDRHPIVAVHVGAFDDGAADRAELVDDDRVEPLDVGRLARRFTPHVDGVSVLRERCLPFDVAFDASCDVDWWFSTLTQMSGVSLRQTGALFRRHRGARHRNTTQGRLRAGFDLVDKHWDVVVAHPGALSFRLERIGRYAAALGDRRLALGALGEAFRLAPSRHVVRELGTAVRVRSSTALPERDDLRALRARIRAARSGARRGGPARRAFPRRGS